MVREKKAKIISLILALAVIVISLIPHHSTLNLHFGLSQNATLHARLLYHFLHANILHALCNAWCLLALVFFYDVSCLQLLLAFIIAATIPDAFLSASPTVGLSGICCALMALVIPIVARKFYYISWVVVFLAFGFLLPAVNALLHIYCFVVGIIIAISVSIVLKVTKRWLVRKE